MRCLYWSCLYWCSKLTHHFVLSHRSVNLFFRKAVRTFVWQRVQGEAVFEVAIMNHEACRNLCKPKPRNTLPLGSEPSTPLVHLPPLTHPMLQGPAWLPEDCMVGGGCVGVKRVDVGRGWFREVKLTAMAPAVLLLKCCQGTKLDQAVG